MHPDINDYIKDKYYCWLDHSEWHCKKAGIPDESIDVLNEVLLYLLKKDQRKLLKLRYTLARYGKFSDGTSFTELDIYILRMIRLNVVSPTSPYQSKYNKSYTEEEVDFSRIILIDEEYDSFDRTTAVLEKFHRVEEAFRKLDLSPKARKIFEHRFIMDLPFSEWNGNESKQELYETYTAVVKLIKNSIEGKLLF